MENEKRNYYDVGLSSNPQDWIFSNSSLSYINPSQGGHPLKLVAFFTENNEEEVSKSLERGSLLHLYMENPEGFAISNVPKPSDKLAIAADNLIADLLTATDTVEVTDEMILANVRNVGWNSKWGDDAVLKNTKDPIKAYVEEVLANRDKHILSEATAKIIQSCIAAINDSEIIQNLIKPTEDEVVFTEHAIYWLDIFARKAKLDRFHVNRKAKLIKHFDYKTTGGSVSNFESTFESYRYYRQMAYYDMALKQYIKYALMEDPEEWTIQHYIIVIETSKPFATTVYPITPFWLNEGYKEIANINQILQVHYDTENFKETYIEITNYGLNKFRDVRTKEPWY
jgi:hypothetical protein